MTWVTILGNALLTILVVILSLIAIAAIVFIVFIVIIKVIAKVFGIMLNIDDEEGDEDESSQ